MTTITIKELLEAGVHFGHQTKRWNPKMKKYLFGERNGIYIIDLQKTLKKFQEAAEFVRRVAAEGLPGHKLGPEALCLKNGNTKGYDGWKDMIVFVASNSVRPVVVDQKLVPVVAGDKNAPYSGCYVNATVTLWSQNNSYGKRINGNLRAVQFVKDGPAFGVAPVDADDEFEALGDTADTSAGPGLADFDIG